MKCCSIINTLARSIINAGRFLIQKSALKALQKEYIQTIKADLATMSKEEGLALLEKLKEDTILKAIPRASVGELFTKKDRTAKNELEVIANVVEQLPENKPLTEVSLMSAFTSPEEDVALGMLSKLSEALHNANMNINQEEYESHMIQAKQRVEMLKNHNLHEALRSDLQDIIDPQDRIEVINDLFAMAHRNDLFDYHNHMHIVHKRYAPDQKQAINLLQEMYLESLMQEMHKQAWQAYGQDSREKRMDEWPEELTPKDKNDIYFNLLAKAKKDPIMHCNIKSDGAEQLQNQIHDMVEKLNDIPDKGASKEVKEFLQNQKKARM